MKTIIEKYTLSEDLQAQITVSEIDEGYLYPAKKGEKSCIAIVDLQTSSSSSSAVNPPHSGQDDFNVKNMTSKSKPKQDEQKIFKEEKEEERGSQREMEIENVSTDIEEKPREVQIEKGKDVLVIADVSGSMSGVIENVRETVRKIGGALGAQDRLGIVTFGSVGSVITPLIHVNSNEFLVEQLCHQIIINGSTNMKQGVDMSIKLLQETFELSPLVLLIMLSDGCPDQRITLQDIDRMKNTLGKLKGTIVFHSFGFTEGHDAQQLQDLTTMSPTSTGMYYFLRTNDDIASSIGDCLGNTSKLSATSLSLKMMVDDDSQVFVFGEEGKVEEEEGNQIQIQIQIQNQNQNKGKSKLKMKMNESNCKIKIWGMSKGEKQSYVFYCKHKEDPKQLPKELKMRIKFTSVDGTPQIKEFQIPLVQDVMTNTDNNNNNNDNDNDNNNANNNINTTVDNSMEINNDKKDELDKMETDINIHSNEEKGKGKEKENEETKDSILLSSSNLQEITSLKESELHIMTHIYRIKVGKLLAKFSDPAVKDMLPFLMEIHGEVLALLGLSQIIENERIIFDEGILQALERDLGYGIESLHDHHNILRSSGTFLQFSHEHLTQRSASTISNMRSTYSTPEQLSMRLRFLQANLSQQSQGIHENKKLNLSIESEGLNEDEIKRRKEIEDNCCYVTLSNWREGSLGIGLLVRPRTIRERIRKLLPSIEIVQDYVSVEAYNSGVRSSFSKNSGGGGNIEGQVFDRDDEEHEEENVMVKSSSRGRINSWLPLYINEEHWNIAKHFAPSAFSLIATQFNDMFKPIYCLTVCARLLCSTIVKFAHEDERASEKGIQMYCDIHRLFLQMMKEHPDVSNEADQILNGFINEPSMRTRKKLADLGDLIQYLGVSKTLSWDDIKYTFVPEMLRRQLRHIETINVNMIPSIDKLFETWYERNPTAGRVTLFNKLFLDVIAKPKGSTIEEVRETYDRSWGKISKQNLDKLKIGFEKILKNSGLMELMEMLEMNLTKEGVAELFLWALENRSEGSVKENFNFPVTKYERVELWRIRYELWEESQQNPPPHLNFLPPLDSNPKKPKIYSSICEMLESDEYLNRSKDQNYGDNLIVTCNCDRCQFNLKKQQMETIWKEKVKREKDYKLTLFVTGFSTDLTLDKIKKYFEKFGEIIDCQLIQKMFKKQSKCSSFITFSTIESMEKAFVSCYWNPPLIKNGSIIQNVENVQNVENQIEKESFENVWKNKRSHNFGNPISKRNRSTIQKVNIQVDNGKNEEEGGKEKEGEKYLIVDIVRYLADPNWIPQRITGTKRTHSNSFPPFKNQLETKDIFFNSVEMKILETFINSLQSSSTTTTTKESDFNQLDEVITNSNCWQDVFPSKMKIIQLDQIGDHFLIPSSSSSSSSSSSFSPKIPLRIYPLDGTTWVEIEQKQFTRSKSKTLMTNEHLSSSNILVPKNTILQINHVKSHSIIIRFWKSKTVLVFM